MRRPWTFATRIAVGFAASLAIALAIAAISALAMRSVLTGNEHLTVDYVQHLAQVERLRRAFSEKLAAQRGFELTRDGSFQRAEARARAEFQEVLVDLRAHAVEKEEARVLDAVDGTELAHQAANARKVEALSGGASPVELALLSQVMMDARVRTEEALTELYQLTLERLHEGAWRSARSNRRALAFILAVAMLGLLVAMGLAWVLTRELWPLHHEVRATEERFRLLVEGVKDYALYLLDPRGRVASWNPGAERIQGWRAEEVIGHPGARVYPPEAVAEGQPERELERVAREGRLESQGWRLRKDDSRFWAESLVTALRDEAGRLEGFAVLTRDITERGRMERAQRLFADAERLFHTERDPDQAVVELAHRLVPELADGSLLFLLSPTGQLEPRAMANVAPEKEQLMWDIFHYQRGKPWPHSAAETLNTGRTERVFEVTPEMRRAAALDAGHLALFERLAIVSYLSVPLRAGGRALGVLILLSHHRERRFTETDQVFIEELAGRAALWLDNAKLLREAQAALELIGVAAHDLGTPLQALQLMLGKLRRAPVQDVEKLREGLTAAMRYTQRLGRMLHNLLDVSRLGSGRLDLEVGEVDLAEVAHEAMARHAEQAAEVGSRLVLDVELGVVGRWDRLRLERVVTNLLSNAFKYGRGKPIEVRVDRVDGHGRLRVMDHGPGIPPEVQRQIFDRFKKAPSRGEKKEGFGLGLYIVRQLVEAHGGTVRVDSEVGQGATFTVELPLSPASREVDASAPPPGLVH